MPPRRALLAAALLLATTSGVAHAAAPPADELYPEQQALRQLSAPEAWRLAGYGEGTTVALLDTGIDETNPQLAGALWTNPGEIAGNGIDDDHDGVVDDVHGVDLVNGDGDPADDEGHGTHVAGIIAAARDRVGTVGLAPGAKLMAVKVLDAHEAGTTNTVAAGIEYALAHGADVINVSLNGDTATPALVRAAGDAAAAGVPIVASAGNDAQDLDARPSYPASLPGDQILGVAATAQTGVLAAFSNFGLDQVDLAAPGQDVVSTKLGGGYEERSGTSMAAPFVTATLALIHGARPDLRGSALVDALRAGEDRPAGLAGLLQGGQLDAVAALRAVVDPARVAAADAQDATPVATLTPRLAARGARRHHGVRRVLLTWAYTGDPATLSGFRLSGAGGATLARRPAAARGAWLTTRARRVRIAALGATGVPLAAATLKLR